MKRLYLLISAFVLSAFGHGQSPFYWEEFNTNTPLPGNPYFAWGNASFGANSAEYWKWNITGLNTPGASNGVMMSRDADLDHFANSSILVSPAINCVGKSAVYLSFTERIVPTGNQLFAFPSVQVSNDSVNWITVYNSTIGTNPKHVNNIDITNVAANQATVYISFNITFIGATNEKWYVDDVKLVDVICSQSATISANGPTTFCSGGSITLNAPAGANLLYQWKKGGVNIAGATGQSYVATAGGNYKVAITDAVTGCSATTANSTTITVNALPAANITPQGSTTFCAGGNVVLAGNAGTGLTYNWKKGANYISGATLPIYMATVGGKYKVEVTNSNGCSKTSAGITVTVPCKGVQEMVSENGFNVSVYPNPSSDDFMITIANQENKKYSVLVYDMIGKPVLQKEIIGSQFRIDNAQLKQGIYSLFIYNEENCKIIKLIKTK